MRDSSAEGQREAAWEVVLQTLGGPPTPDPGLGLESQTDPSPRSAKRSLSVTVLTGFLGAGKTTLICRLLEQTSVQITAIVNDIGSINVDAALIRSRSAETIEFQNGCACCALQTDLRETLEEISSREMLPEAVLIEASGIADPMGIAQTVAHVPGAALDGIVTLVDSTSFHSSTSHPDTASVFARQLAAAHLVLLTKTDATSDMPMLTQEIGELAPGRPILACDDLFLGGGESASEVLLGAAVRGARPGIGENRHEHPAFAVETRTWNAPLPATEFFESLDRLPESLYRMKGSVWLRSQPEEAPRCFHVQVVGPRWRVTDAETESPDSHLVLIGRAETASFREYAATLGTL
ncbi:MAG TPA: GTP-binding protein [Myxococcales bacterium]|nr:GTP-binding protein [Myxococcales bacterium]